MTDPRADVLRGALAAHEPVDAREAASLAVLLESLGGLPRPFDEHAHPTHVTASGIVLGPRGLLLHRHKRMRIWMQPGGHVDPGEPPGEAAVREVAEETGVMGRHPCDGALLLHVDAHDVSAAHRHLDVRYLLWAGAQDPAPPAGESQEVAWCSPERARAIADPGLRGALTALARKGIGGFGP